MARKRNTRLTAAAVKIGTVAGRADRRSREVAKSIKAVKENVRRELRDLTKTADRLARDLHKANKRLRRALR